MGRYKCLLPITNQNCRHRTEDFLLLFIGYLADTLKSYARPVGLICERTDPPCDFGEGRSKAEPKARGDREVCPLLAHLSQPS